MSPIPPDPGLLAAAAGVASLLLAAALARHLRRRRLAARARQAEVERQRDELRCELTQLRQDHARLAEQERLLRIVFEHADTSIALADDQARLILCNQRYAQSLESTPEALVGQPLPPQRHDAEREVDSLYMREIMAGIRDGYQLEQRTVMPSGEPMWRNVNLRVRRDEQGLRTHMVVLVTNVSERKQLEHEHRLRDSLARQSAGLGMWEWNTRTGSVIVDARWAAMLGYRVSELEPTMAAIGSLCHPQDWPLLTEKFRAHLEGQVTEYVCEHRMRHKQGHWVWLHDTGKVLERDAGKRPMRMIGLSRDITPTREAEDALRAARDAADRANRAKSEFLANMSHEIRTPMNAILGLTRLVLGGELQPAQRSQLGKVMASSKALLGILNDILDYSKIEAGCMALEALPFNVDNSLRDLGDLFAGQIEQKGLALQVHRDPDVPDIVVGDSLRLAQVLNNLVGNAIKFTDSGSIEVRMQRAPERPGAAEGSLMLCCEVRDTGIGLSPEVAARLFQPFTQADSSVTRKYGGTGLGLTICQRLVQLMGGEISVSSEPGRGCCFRFTMQVGLGAQALTEADPAEASSALPLPPAHVLLVEDNPLNQEVATGALRHWGLTVSVADNGAQALQRVQQDDTLDLVLMDLHMPVMSGIEATRRIRQLPRARPLPIIAMTAAVFGEDRQECQAAGMVDFVTKPIDAEDLLRALRRWLASPSSAPDEGSAAPQQALQALPAPDAPPARPAHGPTHEGAPRPASGPALPASLSTLAGFDPGAALRLLNGNRARLLSLLRGFREQQGDVCERLQSLYEGRHHPRLIHELHTLRGLMATLGLLGPARWAQQVETELRGGRPLTALPALLDSLRDTLQALDPLLEHGALAAAPATPQAGDRLEARRVLDALAGYLQECELVPEELVEALAHCAHRAGAGSRFRQLHDQISNFDNDAAQRSLEALRAEMDEQDPELAAEPAA